MIVTATSRPEMIHVSLREKIRWNRFGTHWSKTENMNDTDVLADGIDWVLTRNSESLQRSFLTSASPLVISRHEVVGHVVEED